MLKLKSPVCLLLFFLFFGCLMAASLSAATPEEYDRALAAVQKSLQAATDAFDNGDTPPAEKPASVAAQAMAPVHTVEIANGDVYRIHTLALIKIVAAADSNPKLDQREAQYKDLIQHIIVLRRNLDMGSNTLLKRGSGRPKDQLKAVLSAPEFLSDPLPAPSPMESKIDTFLSWLKKLLRFKSPEEPSSPVSVAFIKTLLIALAGALFAFVVWLIVRLIQQSGESGAHRSLIGDTEAAMVEARDKDSLLALAESYAKKGDYRTAFRLIYVATLVALDSGGILRFDRSRTNWEYLRALRDAGRDDLYQAMIPLTGDFDRMWYGFSSADAGDYRRALEYYHSVQASPKPVVGPGAGGSVIS